LAWQSEAGMDDNLEGKYQNVIRRLESDLLAAEMRNQFYAETLAKMTLTEHRLRKALQEIADSCEGCGQFAEDVLKDDAK